MSTEDIRVYQDDWLTRYTHHANLMLPVIDTRFNNSSVSAEVQKLGRPSLPQRPWGDDYPDHIYPPAPSFPGFICDGLAEEKRARYSNSIHKYFIGRKSSPPLGKLNYYYHAAYPYVAYVGDIFISNSNRHNCLGTRLVTNSESDFRSTNPQINFLLGITTPTNVSMCRVFEKAGYQQDTGWTSLDPNFYTYSPSKPTNIISHGNKYCSPEAYSITDINDPNRQVGIALPEAWTSVDHFSGHFSPAGDPHIGQTIILPERDITQSDLYSLCLVAFALTISAKYLNVIIPTELINEPDLDSLGFHPNNHKLVFTKHLI